MTRAVRLGPRWRFRLVSLLLVLGGLLTLLWATGFEPHPVRVALLVGVVFAVGWLVVDTLDAGRADWGGPPEAPPAAAVADRTLASYTRLLADQRVAAEPDPALRDRLVTLARDRDPGLAEPVLRELADQPPRRLTLTEIDDVLRRIEEL